MRIAALLLVVMFNAQADVVGSMTGPAGEKLLLTDELANCQIPESYASYVIDAKRNATATGCYTVKGSDIVIDWVEHGRRYWPMSAIDWNRGRNEKIRSPVL